jgi:hypothetical protein
MRLSCAGRHFSEEPGSQEIIKTQRKSLLELPVLALQEELLSGFAVNKKEVLVYKNDFLYI